MTARSPRRVFLNGATAALGVAIIGCASQSSGEAKSPGTDEKDQAEVTPGEDLMQEHGVLERVLLIYEESARRLEAGEAVDPAVVRGGADVVRRFIEEYHEKTEENHVFPRLEAARREVALVATLRVQHQRGRELTAAIAAAVPGSADLVPHLRAFSRMYRPHAAREDTVLFPAFREVVGKSAYSELGEQFEEEEHERFGEGGFDKIVAEVARYEAALGIGDLARFTPRATKSERP